LKFFSTPLISHELYSGDVEAWETDGVGGYSYSYSEDAFTEPAADAIPIDEEDDQNSIPEPEEYNQARVLLYSEYVVRHGDIPGRIALQFGLSAGTILSVNNIINDRTLQIGQTLQIPNQDGILYQVKSEKTLAKIAEEQGVTVESIIIANEIFSQQDKGIAAGETLFIPGAKLDKTTFLEITGLLFKWPTTVHRITSPYGSRPDPFGSNRRLFHAGLDIGAPYGTPVYASMAGRVSFTGYNGVYGNHVTITHGAGYKTLYGHLSKISVKEGSYVDSGQEIGKVGSTGQSTGPHLHFTVYKDGATVNPQKYLK
jgi:murein DD-endopeptidase MepM/ murein hydrolase activator NlpD